MLYHQKRIINNSNIEDVEYTLSTLASMAWQIDHDTNSAGRITTLEVDIREPDLYNYFIESDGSATYSIFQLDMSDNTIRIGTQKDNLVEYTTTTFDSNNLAGYLVAIGEALDGQKL